MAEELDRDRAIVLVDIDDDSSTTTTTTITGWIAAWVVEDEVHVLDVAVASPFRRQGIGSRLLQAVLQSKQASHAATALLEVRPDNHGAIEMYKRAGFEVVGVRRRFYSNGDDAFLMNCTL